MNSITRLENVFRKKESVLMPYMTLGYPDFERSLDIIQACAEAGAAVMELGIPFSDPLADGPTIQNSTQIALKNGMSVRKSLMAVKKLRERGVRIPLVMMSYYNPILAYGPEKFAVDAKQMGANAILIPDLPVEESDHLEKTCREAGVALIYMLTSLSSEERIAQVVQRASGFLYLTAVNGTTGSRGELDTQLESFIQRVRKFTELPLVVGFGVSTPEQVRDLKMKVDGIITGSALIDHIGCSEYPVQAASDFIQTLVNVIA
jgi:tryptophan synthase alpha chain